MPKSLKLIKYAYVLKDLLCNIAVVCTFSIVDNSPSFYASFCVVNHAVGSTQQSTEFVLKRGRILHSEKQKETTKISIQRVTTN